MRRITVIIRGRVQGVGFRIATERQASMRGLSGWVRNTSDGSVEACLEGDDGQVEAMLRWLEDGPALARVEDLEIARDERAAQASMRSFEVRG